MTTTLCMSILAWTPFLEPAPAIALWWWALAIPMALFVAMAYKATRVKEMTDFWRATIKMTVQILAAMIGIAVGLALLIQVLLPMLPAE
ncbi:MAG: hypothetical protein EXS10_03215 [Phycisphaerales bacterium]|nr:hypothetical protein [Phycisphaerales bacterium]